MKVLCYINHFFGQNAKFIGKSSIGKNFSESEINRKAERRKVIIETAIEALKKIDGIEIKICAINGFSLLPIDIHFENIKDNPINLVYESLNRMADHLNDYDYFINIEDDILLPLETFENILAFDKKTFVNEILLPNRLEKNPNGENFCVDLFASPGWTTQQKNYAGSSLKVAMNVHSGIFIASKEKLRYAISSINRDFRGITLGTGMESAFAYFHSPFSVYRSTDLSFHSIYHLDHWTFSPMEENISQNIRSMFSKLRLSDFVPPILMYMFRFIKKKLSGKRND